MLLEEGQCPCFGLATLHCERELQLEVDAQKREAEAQKLRCEQANKEKDKFEEANKALQLALQTALVKAARLEGEAEQLKQRLGDTKSTADQSMKWLMSDWSSK